MCPAPAACWEAGRVPWKIRAFCAQPPPGRWAERHNGGVPDFAEFRLADDTVVRLELAPVGAEPPVSDDPSDDPSDGRPDAGHAGNGEAWDGQLDDLPEGFSTPVPAGRGSRGAALAAGTLRGALRPLGLVIQEVHDSLGALDNPPQEVSVELGVQIGQDLKMGIVGANGQASMKVSATWRLPAAPANSAVSQGIPTGAPGASGPAPGAGAR